MEIKTKFDIDEYVYFLKNDKVHHCKIIRITTTAVPDSKAPYRLHIVYDVYGGSVDSQTTVLSEERCFKTKEELLASL